MRRNFVRDCVCQLWLLALLAMFAAVARVGDAAAAQEKAAATAEVKIDNFSFGPRDVDCAGGNDRDVDESR